MPKSVVEHAADGYEVGCAHGARAQLARRCDGNGQRTPAKVRKIATAVRARLSYGAPTTPSLMLMRSSFRYARTRSGRSQWAEDTDDRTRGATKRANALQDRMVDPSHRSTPNRSYSGPTEPAITQPRPKDGSAGMPAVGDILAGAYRLLRELGSGAMGVVFEAQDQLLTRRVAVKVSSPGVDPSYLQAEGRALAALRHPSMPTVFAMGLAGPLPYLVMERIPGVVLGEHLELVAERGQKLSPIEALDVLVPLAEALEAVHRAGIAHRDVKPDNVMLAPAGRVVLMDFGVMVPESLRARLRAAGTPKYMAPEAFSGEIGADSAYLFDIYAFGLTAFEVFGGRIPFVGKTPGEVLRSHLTVTLPSLREVRDDLPQKAIDLVAELAHRERDQRTQSMGEVVSRLRELRRELARPERREDRPPSILIIEDDAAIARLVATVAKRALPNAEIRIAPDAEQGLMALNASPPDVLVLDLNLPRMNGIELCMYLCGAPIAGLRVLAVSAAARSDDIALLERLGFCQFIPKDGAFTKKLAETLPSLIRKTAA